MSDILSAAALAVVAFLVWALSVTGTVVLIAYIVKAIFF